MAKVVGVKFNHSSKVYYFNPEDKNYKKDDKVIVETSRGVEFGVIACETKEVDDKDVILPLTKEEYESIEIKYNYPKILSKPFSNEEKKSITTSLKLL